jgi:Vacuolar-sorting-associated 13 protein C-terminal/SHR-binding domain of vacuolar-sorting associated protein 13
MVSKWKERILGALRISPREYVRKKIKSQFAFLEPVDIGQIDYSVMKGTVFIGALKKKREEVCYGINDISIGGVAVRVPWYNLEGDVFGVYVENLYVSLDLGCVNLGSAGEKKDGMFERAAKSVMKKLLRNMDLKVYGATIELTREGKVVGNLGIGKLDVEEGEEDLHKKRAILEEMSISTTNARAELTRAEGSLEYREGTVLEIESRVESLLVEVTKNVFDDVREIRLLLCQRREGGGGREREDGASESSVVGTKVEVTLGKTEVVVKGEEPGIVAEEVSLRMSEEDAVLRVKKVGRGKENLVEDVEVTRKNRENFIIAEISRVRTLLNIRSVLDLGRRVRKELKSVEAAGSGKEGDGGEEMEIDLAVAEVDVDLKIDEFRTEAKLREMKVTKRRVVMGEGGTSVKYDELSLELSKVGGEGHANRIVLAYLKNRMSCTVAGNRLHIHKMDIHAPNRAVSYIEAFDTMREISSRIVEAEETSGGPAEEKGVPALGVECVVESLNICTVYKGQKTFLHLSMLERRGEGSGKESVENEDGESVARGEPTSGTGAVSIEKISVTSKGIEYLVLHSLLLRGGCVEISRAAVVSPTDDTLFMLVRKGCALTPRGGDPSAMKIFLGELSLLLRNDLARGQVKELELFARGLSVSKGIEKIEVAVEEVGIRRETGSSLRCSLVAEKEGRRMDISSEVQGVIGPEEYVFLVNRVFLGTSLVMEMLDILFAGSPDEGSLAIHGSLKTELRLEVPLSSEVCISAMVDLNGVNGGVLEMSVVVRDVSMKCGGEVVASVLEMAVSVDKAFLSMAVAISLPEARITHRVGALLSLRDAFVDVDFNYGAPTVSGKTEFKCTVEKVVVESGPLSVEISQIKVFPNYISLNLARVCLLENGASGVEEDGMKDRIWVDLLERPVDIVIKNIDEYYITTGRVYLALKKEMVGGLREGAVLLAKGIQGPKSREGGIRTTVETERIVLFLKKSRSAFARVMLRNFCVLAGEELVAGGEMSVYCFNRTSEMYDPLIEECSMRVRKTVFPFLEELEHEKFYSLVSPAGSSTSLQIQEFEYVVEFPGQIRAQITEEIRNMLQEWGNDGENMKITFKNTSSQKMEVRVGNIEASVCVSPGEAAQSIYSSYDLITISAWMEEKVSIFRRPISSQFLHSKQAGEHSFVCEVARDQETIVVIRESCIIRNLTNSVVTIRACDPSRDPGAMAELKVEQYNETSVSTGALPLETVLEIDDGHGMKKSRPLEIPRVNLRFRSKNRLVMRQKLELRSADKREYPSYIMVAMHVVVVDGVPFVSLVIHHDFILTNLTDVPLDYRLKIVGKRETEQIVGVLRAREPREVTRSQEEQKKASIKIGLSRGGDSLRSGVKIDLACPEEKEVLLKIEDIVLEMVKTKRAGSILGVSLDLSITEIEIYPRAICVNKTAEEVWVKTSRSRVEVPPGMEVMASFSRDKLSLEVARRETAPFNFKLPGVILAEIKRPHRSFIVDISEGRGKRRRTMYLVVDYASIVNNKSGYAITLHTEYGRVDADGNDPVPVHIPKNGKTWISSGRSEKNTLVLKGLTRQIVKLTDGDAVKLISVRIHLQSGQQVVEIRKETEWPYIIRNKTEHVFAYRQRGHGAVYKLGPGESTGYYWDSFEASAAFEFSVENELLVVKEFGFTHSKSFEASFCNKDGKGVITVSRTGKQFLEEPEACEPQSIFSLRIASVALSLVKDTREFCCVHLSGLLAKALFSSGIEMFFSCEGAQVDRQDLVCRFPIVLKNNAARKFITLRLWLVPPSPTINYISFSLGEFLLELEEEFVTNVYMYFFPEECTFEETTYFVRCRECKNLRCSCGYVERVPGESKDVCIRVIHIGDIKAKFSLRRAEKASRIPVPNVLCNLSNCKLSFDQIVLNDLECSTSELRDALVEMYKRHAINNVIPILLSVDAVGSPGALIEYLQTGVHDLIYEPYRTLDNPIMIPKGIMKGGKSFVKNTLCTVTGMLSSLTGTLGSGIARASFDPKFIELTDVPTTNFYVGEELLVLPTAKESNLTRAGEKFLDSVVSGIKGVVDSPLEGGRSRGLGGMFQGIGKGLVGAIVKPVAGAVGFAKDVTSSLTDVMSDKKRLLRLQFPRAPSPFPVEYQEERNLFYHVYRRIAGGEKDELFINGGACAKKPEWFAAITTRRVLTYNDEDLLEFEGSPEIEAAGCNTTVRVGPVNIEIVGTRVYREAQQASAALSSTE